MHRQAEIRPPVSVVDVALDAAEPPGAVLLELLQLFPRALLPPVLMAVGVLLVLHVHGGLAVTDDL